MFIYLINTLICAIQMFRKNEESFSLNKIIHIFIFTFFILANYIQNINNINATSLIIYFEPKDYLYFQEIVLLILLIYNIFYFYFRKITDYQCGNNYKRCIKENCEIKIVLLSLLSLLSTIYLYKDQPIFLFFRSVEDEIRESISANSSFALISSKFIRPIPFACYLMYKLSDSPKTIYCRILFILMTLSVFPLSLARNAVAMYWLPICIINFKIIYRKYVFTSLLLFSILFIFPFLDNFRSFNGVINTEINFDYLKTMNFDASQMFMGTMKMEIITYGNQLLGVLLFFVPRSIWPTKPVGSGCYVAESHGYFTNVSMPYFAEGYINWGIIGIVIFTIILSKLTAHLDNKYWLYKQSSSIFDNGLYLIFVGALFFILRGDLLSSTAYTVGTILCYYFVYRLFTHQ